MSLWTPYLDEPLDLSTQKTTLVPPNCYCPVLHQEVSKREDNTHQEYKPVYSPPQDTFSLESINNFVEEYFTKDLEYQQFEKDALEAMAQSNGGRIVHSNPRMRRDIHTSEQTSDEYRMQRQKNNMAAKMSRDRRKMREIKRQIQLEFLTKKIQNIQRLLDEPNKKYHTRKYS